MTIKKILINNESNLAIILFLIWFLFELNTIGFKYLLFRTLEIWLEDRFIKLKKALNFTQVLMKDNLDLKDLWIVDENKILSKLTIQYKILRMINSIIEEVWLVARNLKDVAAIMLLQ